MAVCEGAASELQARLAAPDHVETPTETGLDRSVPWPSVQSLLEGGEAILAQDHSPQQAWELQAV